MTNGFFTGGNQSPFEPRVRIYNIQGTSQFVVQNGTSETYFIKEEDAWRFARSIAPDNPIPIRVMPAPNLPDIWPARVVNTMHPHHVHTAEAILKKWL